MNVVTNFSQLVVGWYCGKKGNRDECSCCRPELKLKLERRIRLIAASLFSKPNTNKKAFCLFGDPV